MYKKEALKNYYYTESKPLKCKQIQQNNQNNQGKWENKLFTKNIIM